MREVTELNNDDTGLYNVQTETSSYVIDMDEKIAMRVPYSGAGMRRSTIVRKISKVVHK